MNVRLILSAALAAGTYDMTLTPQTGEPQPGGTPIPMPQPGPTPDGAESVELHGQQQYPFSGDFAKRFVNIQPPKNPGPGALGFFKCFDRNHGDNIPGRMVYDYGGSSPLITDPSDSVYFTCGAVDRGYGRFNVQPGGSVKVTGSDLQGPLTLDARTPDVF